MTFGGDFRLKPRSVVKGLWPVAVFLMLNTLGVVNANADTRKMYDEVEHRHVDCADLECGPGEQWTYCTSTDPTAGTCKPCPDRHFQPRNNSRFNQLECNLKFDCDHFVVNADSVKDTTVDNICGCNNGWRLSGKTQCIPNPRCPKGQGKSRTGVCEKCLPKGEYSDVANNYQPCKKLTTCAGCVYEDSHGGTQDRHCGRLIGGRCVKGGESARTTLLPASSTTTSPLTPTKAGIIPKDSHSVNIADQAGLHIGLPVGLGVLVIIIIVGVLAYKRHEKGRKEAGKRESPTSSDVPLLSVPPGYEQILQRAEESEPYAKKIWELCMAKIPGNLGHKRRALARQLYGQDFLGEHTAFLDNFERDNDRFYENE